MALLKILTVILILLFPLGELGRINVYNEISATVNDFLVGLLIVVWWILTVKRNRLTEISRKQLAKPIFLFVFMAFLSLIFNANKLNLPEFLASFLYLLRFVSYVGIYFVVSGFDLNFKRKIITLMVISGSLVAFGGFIQYFLYPDLRNLYYMGWDEHLYRLFSSFLDPNFTAVVISLFLILILSFLFLGTIINKKIKMLLVTLSILAFIALLLTYSRSGYLMLITSISVLFIILGRKRYIAILFAAFALALVLLPKDFGGEGIKLLRTASIIARSEYVGNAIAIFKDNPILGIGFNAYRYAQYKYGFIEEESLRISHAAAGTDNSFLFVLATTGIVGFAFYLWMWFRILKALNNGTMKQFNNATMALTIKMAIFASATGLFVNALFINSLFYPFIMEWMWILIGLKENR